MPPSARAPRPARDTPIFVQVTVETTGTLLVGADIAAAATVIDALDVPLIGLNCATGPQEMAEHVQLAGRELAAAASRCSPMPACPSWSTATRIIRCAPAELAQWQERFVTEDGVNLIGGCCGTDAPSTSRALDAMLRRLAGDGARPRRQVRAQRLGAVGRLALRPDAAAPGERLSLDRRALQRQRLEADSASSRRRATGTAASRMAREQVKEGSHALDVCTAFVGRDEIAEMTRGGDAHARRGRRRRWSIDSTELPVLEAALKLYGGKPIINSINFEDGEAPAGQAPASSPRRFGAAVIALTIDEQGMAKDVDAQARGRAAAARFRLRASRAAGVAI